ncbi:MAG TPA: SRPBCC family protein [Flavisolibacter sp.]|nr:SRPBCC family protein [Flavisolibacter sp.]
MSFIHLTTFVQAPAERLFNLSLSVDLHKQSMTRYKEEIIDGLKHGQMNLNDTVTWKAKHLFRERTLKTKITQLKEPDYFIDEQVEGSFVFMKHEHYFKPIENGTFMIDQFRYKIKYGNAGKLLNKIFLEKYITRLLNERNMIIKKIAESDQWKQFLNK